MGLKLVKGSRGKFHKQLPTDFDPPEVDQARFETIMCGIS